MFGFTKIFSFILFALLLRFSYEEEAEEYLVTHQVFFDMSVGGTPLGRIIIGLFGEIAPKTVENFYKIATEGINGKTYAGTKIIRVIKRFMIQGGDIVNDDGTGFVSIYGNYFKDENFAVQHKSLGFISMVNEGDPDTNGCQFIITTRKAPGLDRRHTVFGKVIQGEDILRKIETEETDGNDHPVRPVTITRSGRILTPTAFYIEDGKPVTEKPVNADSNTNNDLYL